MTLCPEDPERWETFRGRHEAAVADFKTGIDSADVFRARLYGLGYRGDEIAREVAFHQEPAGPVPLAETRPARALIKAADLIEAQPAAETGPIRVSQELADLLRAAGGDLRVFDDPMAPMRARQRDEQRDADDHRVEFNAGNGIGAGDA